jgi:hypothetical protein
MDTQSVRNRQTLAKQEKKAFQNCAEPWMAELKRPMDGLERVLESPVLLIRFS